MLLAPEGVGNDLAHPPIVERRLPATRRCTEQKLDYRNPLWRLHGHKRAGIWLSSLVAFATLSSTLALSTPVEGPEVNDNVIAPAQLTSPSMQTPAITIDYALTDGHFYSRGASGQSPLAGYSVKGALWRSFNDLGGLASLGYPISRQWIDAEGRLNQAFERGLVRLPPGASAEAAERADVMDTLSEAGFDRFLEEQHMVPPSGEGPAPALSGRQIPAASKSLLDRDSLIRSAFLSTLDWPERLGLPVAIKSYDRVISLRTQRGVLRHWLEDSPQAAAGTVEVVDGARLAKEMLVTADSARPEVSPRHGWLRVKGDQIVDATDTPVRIAGVNWSGFELRSFAPSGLAMRDYKDIIDRISALGFNTIRLPFSNEMVERNPTPAQQDVAACPSCAGRSALDILDLIVDYAGQRGMRIILDNHFSGASDLKGAPLWYTDQYPDSAWLKDWQGLAGRFRDSPAVVGFDLRNEPHGPATWGSGDPKTDWRLAAERAGNAILAINPNALIIVEGVEQFMKQGGGPDFTWWGANLMGARSQPVRLPEANLLYSPHEYGPKLYQQRWFDDHTTAQSLREVWTHYWAYLNLEQDKPLLIGEVGTGNATEDIFSTKAGSQGQWFQAISAFIRERGNLNWTYWTINFDDPFTLLDAGYEDVVNPAKLSTLAPLLGRSFAELPPIVTGGQAGLATIPRSRAL